MSAEVKKKWGIELEKPDKIHMVFEKKKKKRKEVKLLFFSPLFFLKNSKIMYNLTNTNNLYNFFVLFYILLIITYHVFI